MTTKTRSPETRPDGLIRLEADLARDIERLNYPPANWVPQQTGPDGEALCDVLIVGAGMCGLTASFALKRLGIARQRLIDRAPAGTEGPWLTFARMQRLRSPKHLTGPAMGLPNLTFRAWYEAQHGAQAWEPLGRIPRPMWAEYLVWYARVTGAQVENCVTLDRVEPASGGLRTHLVHGDGRREIVHARKIVLATGRESPGQARIPQALRAEYGNGVKHSSDAINFAALKDKRVVVIGMAASAFDNAACALEAGAATVVMLGRAPAMPRINKAKQIVYAGFTFGYPELSDAEKMAVWSRVFAGGIAAPRESVQRVTCHANAQIRFGTEVTACRRDGTALHLVTSTGLLPADLVILGTGFDVDVPGARSICFAEYLDLWRNRLPPGSIDDAVAREMASFPYLDPGFRYQTGVADLVPHARRLHAFSHVCMVSLGNLANDIPAVSEGADRLARAIAVDLFEEDKAIHWQRLDAYAEPELLGDEVPGLTSWSPPVE
jgi:FAD-dependent urate hydroxylase